VKGIRHDHVGGIRRRAVTFKVTFTPRVFSINNDLLVTPNTGLGDTFDFLHLWEMLKGAL